jgi:hypothetical protein
MLEYILKNGNTFQRGQAKGILREVSLDLGYDPRRPEPQVIKKEKSNDLFLLLLPVKMLGALVFVLFLTLAAMSFHNQTKPSVAAAGGSDNVKTTTHSPKNHR